MAENKTKATNLSPIDYLNSFPDGAKKQDAFAILELMAQLTGEPAKMWGPSMIGFGSYDYKYDSGHSGTMFKVGFSPRKANLVFYIISGVAKQQELLTKLGKHKIGASCLYVNKLADINLDVLKDLILAAYRAPAFGLYDGKKK